MLRALGVYVGVRTWEVFLCFVAFLVLGASIVTSFFVCFTSLVSFAGSYNEDEPALVCSPFPPFRTPARRLEDD